MPLAVVAVCLLVAPPVALAGPDRVGGEVPSPGGPTGGSDREAALRRLVAGLGFPAGSPERVADRSGRPRLRFRVARPLEEVVAVLRKRYEAGGRVGDEWTIGAVSYTPGGDLWLFPTEFRGDRGIHTIEVEAEAGGTTLTIPLEGRYDWGPGRGHLVYCPDELASGEAVPTPESRRTHP